jgi:hypothetical protein
VGCVEREDEGSMGKKKGRPEKRMREIFSAEDKSSGDGGRVWQLF